jgi:hypothetical protein
LVYLTVAGFSLFAIWYGGQAQGTSTALAQLERTLWGTIVLFLIFVGVVAYGVWHLVDALYDLEDKGSGGKGIIVRIGMVVTGVVHFGLGIAAFLLLFAGGGSSGGESSITKAIDVVLDWPAGRWIVALAGAAVVGAGIAYAVKAWKMSYLDHLRANRVTANWNWLLRFGVLAHAVIIVIIGALILYAAWTHDPSAAGGTEQSFAWLHDQPYGRILVGTICVGLLGFAVFCFVNAVWRIVPKIDGDDVETLGIRLKQTAERQLS